MTPGYGVHPIFLMFMSIPLIILAFNVILYLMGRLVLDVFNRIISGDY